MSNTLFGYFKSNKKKKEVKFEDIKLSKYLTSESWIECLKKEFTKPYFIKLDKFIDTEYQNNIIYPEKENIFNALNKTDLSSVKVVILGQDPYHSPNTAMGLSFSVAKPKRPPPSLKNIYKELNDDEDVDFTSPEHGSLLKWAYCGVLLLNTVLTVRESSANSHKGKGWEEFTDMIIKQISRKRKNVVFMLWGNKAKNKASLIDSSKHYVLKAAHPSPFSADNGFFGCKHFSLANGYLEINGIQPVDWKLSNAEEDDKEVILLQQNTNNSPQLSESNNNNENESNNNNKNSENENDKDEELEIELTEEETSDNEVDVVKVGEKRPLDDNDDDNKDERPTSKKRKLND